MDGFTISSSEVDGTAVLELSGDLDLTVKAALVDHVDRLLGLPDVAAIVVDVTQVEFIDSSGIGALVGCRLNADGAGRGFRVRGVHGQVAEVLTMTGVLPVLTGGA
jgi:anti-anti-sigma factor